MGTAADQVLFTIWFFVFSGVIALVAVVGVGAQSRRLAGAASGVDRRLDSLLALDPALPTPWQDPASLAPARRAPGDRSSSAGRSPPAPLWIGPTLNQNAKAFGSFGVMLGLFAYILILITISMVCAVFAPVWAEWRQVENDNKSQGVEEADVSSKPAVVSGTAGCAE